MEEVTRVGANARSDINAYLASLPATPRQYLFRELPIFLENSGNSLKSLAKELNIGRNTLGEIARGKNITAEIHPNLAGSIIQRVAPPGLHIEVLKKYYPWLRSNAGELELNHVIDSALLAEVLNDLVNYALYNQAGLGEGITATEVFDQWDSAGLAQMFGLEKLGLIARTELEDGEVLFRCTDMGNFRTLSDENILSRILNCVEYIKKFPQRRPSKSLGSLTGLFDPEAQQDIKKEIEAFTEKVYQIRAREMGPGAKKIFICYLTGEFPSKNGDE